MATTEERLYDVIAVLSAQDGLGSSNKFLLLGDLNARTGTWNTSHTGSLRVSEDSATSTRGRRLLGHVQPSSRSVILNGSERFPASSFSTSFQAGGCAAVDYIVCSADLEHRVVIDRSSSRLPQTVRLSESIAPASTFEYSSKGH